MNKSLSNENFGARDCAPFENGMELPGFFNGHSLYFYSMAKNSKNPGGIIRKSVVRSVVIFLWIGTFWAGGSCRNPARASVIARIQSSSESIVTVTAAISGLFKTPVQSVLNKKTGQMVNRRALRAVQSHQKGLGIIIDQAGIIVTNAHIVQNATQIAVTLSDGTPVPAQPVYLAKDDDLAFLKIHSSTPLKAIPFADSDQLKIRTVVYSLGGSPFTKNTISEGMVTGLEKTKRSRHGTVKVGIIQMNFKVYQGDSGSPILNEHAELLGMTAAGTLTGRQAALAISANIIREHLTEYLKSLTPDAS